MRLLSCLFAAVSLLLAPAASAQVQSIEFSIGTRNYAMQVPDGYCLPEGHLVDASDRVARSDRANFTLATLYRCDDERIYTDRWFLVKTARATTNMELIDKEKWLLVWEESFSRSSEGAVDQDIVVGAERDISAEFGAETSIATQRDEVGRDSNCVYTRGGGTIRMGDSQQELRTAGGLCIIGQRAISLHAYDNREGASSDELLERVKDVYAAIRLRD